MKMRLIALLSILVFLASPLYAATIKGKIKGTSFRNGTAILTGSTNGATKAGTVSSSGKFSLQVPAGNKYAYLDVRDSSGKVYPAFVKNCAKKCVATKLHPLIKAGANLTFSAKSGRILAYDKVTSKWKKLTDTKKFVTSGKAGSATNFGRVSGTNSKTVTGQDSDGDGLPGSYDVDADNDGILNNYDSASSGLRIRAGEDTGTFPLFSNFKINLDESLNLHMGGLTQELIDMAMQTTTTLAIGIAGGPGAGTHELDCGGLSYCSTGGTGVAVDGAGAFPDTMDADADGMGEITAGNTGDFQLRTGAPSSAIGSGDVLMQWITDAESKVTSVPAILNFVFSTTPAVKNVTVHSEGNSDEYTVDYSQPGNRLGGMNNPFMAYPSGDVLVDITAWRPQRAGIAAAGEAQYMDIGHSLVVIDIPNTPVGDGMGGGGQGPGNCTVTAYSTTDPNLSADGNGLVDNASDVAADASNTFSFTINLTECLQNAHSGPISWAAGETLAVDLQLKNSTGDNAAQKFYVRRGV